MTKILWFAAVLVVFPAAGAADAAVTILGDGYARKCYEAAEFNRAGRTAFADCNLALKQDALSSSERAATHVNRGILFMQGRDYANAIADYDTALGIDDDLAEAYINKGIAVLHRGGSETLAVDLLSRGIALTPSRLEIALYARGVAYEKLGRAREAYLDYREAAALKPDWPEPAQELTRFKVIE
ncbi:MAG: hypothetical protein JNL46_09400 [Sphingosinicella sp.]|nr:hypothetical protein [Sphingosinicella sp.]